MSELSDDYRAMAEESKRRRASNRHNSARLLTRHGITFASKNGGAHLIVSAGDQTIDFWPGTGRWIVRGGRRGFGVFNLIRHIKPEDD